MNYFLKTPLLFAILGVALLSKTAFAETSSGSSSTATTQNPKASAADQPDPKTSAATQPEVVKGSTTAHPADSITAHSVKQSASGKEDSASSDPVAAPKGPALFKLLDTDKDGRISLAEFVAYGTTPDVRTTGSVKTPQAGNAHSESPSGSAPGNASSKSKPAKPAHSENTPSENPEPALPGAGILTSTDTRAGKYTAEVFENLDINHDKFLSQAELDALIPAHQISQP